MVLETDRLYLREMNQNDFHSLCKILQDEDTMYAFLSYRFSQLHFETQYSYP